MSRTGLSESLQLHWQRSPLAQRWQTLPARDRLALAALSVFLLLVLLSATGMLAAEPARGQASVSLVLAPVGLSPVVHG